ncbi:hypothetical protein FD723_07730 [Nostoc sp. C052]|uniref:right-handed parallel beta-helix repeat-containing protein n=1 Tax=Nostoc sp. C052 TaxID=2576902 RepID=UPI0015C2F883|nr:right-handed parallel beta-helix repeat-containing protein [Nostoc sp. C052]QLE40356.1 hypothetical protein FD723_07730 [Nostoc sp. C052]
MSTFTVTNTNNSGTGSLRQAILDANALSGKDIINFGGLFTDGLAHKINLTGSGLSITDNLTIEGTNPSKLTIKDDSASRVFDIASGVTAAINGLTITNSYKGSEGGAISNEGVLTLSNSTITGNTAYIGGGIYNQGNLTVNYSTITDNTALFDGGGIDSSNDRSIVIVNHSTISGNKALYGGGIYIDIAEGIQTLSVSNSSISNNSANFSGGGIFIGGDDIDDTSSGGITTSVSNSIISRNSALEGSGGGIYDGASGGGIYNTTGAISYIVGFLSTITVTNSIISGNTAGADGGGIFNHAEEQSYFYSSNSSSSTITLTNSIISGNTARADGGGIFNLGIISVTNSTISGNKALTAGGGGIYNGGFTYPGYKSPDSVAYGNLTVTKSAINDNSGSTGGGIYNKGSLLVSYSNISDNYARDYGGGIYNSSFNEFGMYNTLGIVTVTHSSISGNTALTAGGGIYNDLYKDFGKIVPFIGTVTYTYNGLSTVKVFNSVISANQAHFGGGIYNNASLTVGNSIIRHNKAFGIELSSGGEESGTGGGIYNSNSSYALATVDYSLIVCNFDTPKEDSTRLIKLDNLVGKFITKGSLVRV